MMTSHDLLGLPESKTLEFKRDLSSLQPILKTLVAFANTAGGKLVIGVKDDRAVCGVENVLGQEERLANAIADSIVPAMTPEIEAVTHEGKDLLIVTVAHWRGPFYIKSEGPERGVYMRLGSTSREAGPEMIAEMRRSLADASFDQLPCPEVGLDGLDTSKIEAAFAVVGREVDEAKLESLGVAVRHAGSLVASNGGVILFGRAAALERHFPDARVSCARFRGNSKAEFIDRLDLEGSVFDAVEGVPKFIRRNTRMAAKIEGMRRQDIPEYPEVAVREALINSIVHADYSLTGMRTLVAVFDDRMEIQNPGALPFGMTLDDLKAGVSRVRNRVIARVFRELELIEEWGSGYRRIVDACQAGGYSEPRWEEHGSALRVVFPTRLDVVEADKVALHGGVNEGVNEGVNRDGGVNGGVNDGVNQRQRWFLDRLDQGESLNTPDIERYWQISPRTADRDVAGLIQLGLIEFVGPPKTGHYRPMRRER